ncbi:MAG: hypothetical protein ACXWB5_04060, partial [Kaistella sp.]
MPPVKTLKPKAPSKNGSNASVKSKALPKNGNGNGNHLHGEKNGASKNGNSKHQGPKELFSRIPIQQVVQETALTEADLFKVLLRVRNGDFSVRLPDDQVGMTGKICDTLNEIIELNERMVFEFEKVGTSIGKQGKL